jgi:hypothetical protein
MKKKQGLLLKIWHNPFGNILLIFIGTQILTSILALFKAAFEEEGFIESFISISRLKIPIWVIVVIIVLALFARRFFNNRKFTYDEDTLKKDREFFNKIRNNLLPQDGVIRFLRDHNFGFSFGFSHIDNLHDYYYKKDNSDFEFSHPELESLKNELTHAIVNLRRVLSTKTLYNDDDVLQGISKELPEKVFNEIAEDLNEKAEVVCDKYDILIRTGRRILKIN